MWAGLNGFDPRTNLELGGVRIGMDCMNLVTVISGYTRVPVTLSGIGTILLTKVSRLLSMVQVIDTGQLIMMRFANNVCPYTDLSLEVQLFI